MGLKDRLWRLDPFAVRVAVTVVVLMINLAIVSVLGLAGDRAWWWNIGVGMIAGGLAAIVANYVVDVQTEWHRTELYRAEVERLEAKLRDEGKL
jgi:hypothetical protein